MFDGIFDLPVFVAAPALVGGLCLVALGGLILVRRLVIPRLIIHSEDSEFIGAMLQSVMVFYGLAVALIAVSVWQTYSDVSRVVSQEASALNALYRDVTSYPEPLRATLQQMLREYTGQVIHEGWALQRKGKTPTAGFGQMTRFQEALTKFEPMTEGQKVLHAETLRAYNVEIQARRMRLDAATTGLPPVMWWVIFLGALISLSASLFFRVDDLRLHGIMVVLLATFMGLVIFMILALDRPFRGDLGLSPAPYELIYDQLMKPASD